MSQSIKQTIIVEHLPFIKDMLNKVKGTEYEGKWQKTMDLISSGRYKLLLLYF